PVGRAGTGSCALFPVVTRRQTTFTRNRGTCRGQAGDGVGIPSAVVSSRSDPSPPTLRRVVIEALTPSVDGGRFAAKCLLVACVRLEADAFADGHDLVAALVELTAPDGTTTSVEMASLGNDRFAAHAVVDQLGAWCWRVVAWVDHVASWHRDLLAFAA